MADLAAKVLQLSPEQHDALGHAIALAHAIHASIGGKGIGVAPRITRFDSYQLYSGTSRLASPEYRCLQLRDHRRVRIAGGAKISGADNQRCLNVNGGRVDSWVDWRLAPIGLIGWPIGRLENK